jgi:hypothetical protein
MFLTSFLGRIQSNILSAKLKSRIKKIKTCSDFITRAKKNRENEATCQTIQRMTPENPYSPSGYPCESLDTPISLENPYEPCMTHDAPRNFVQYFAMRTCVAYSINKYKCNNYVTIIPVYDVIIYRITHQKCRLNSRIFCKCILFCNFSQCVHFIVIGSDLINNVNSRNDTVKLMIYKYFHLGIFVRLWSLCQKAPKSVYKNWNKMFILAEIWCFI